MIVGMEGTKPDPKKIKTLQVLPLPNKVREMQSFLGIVNYLSPKIANLTGSIKTSCKEGKYV